MLRAHLVMSLATAVAAAAGSFEGRMLRLPCSRPDKKPLSSNRAHPIHKVPSSLEHHEVAAHPLGLLRLPRSRKSSILYLT